MNADELWAVSDNWSDMFVVKAAAEGLPRAVGRAPAPSARRCRSNGERGALRVLVAPESEWAMRLMVIETDPQYAKIWSTMQRTSQRLAEHALAGHHLSG